MLTGSIANIIAVWERAPLSVKMDGARWYETAHQIGLDLDRAFNLADGSGAGILAALSPSLSWERNISAAWELCETGRTKWQSGANNAKALRIRNGESPDAVLGGPKVRAFWATINDPDGFNPAVIDRHAVAVWTGANVPDKQAKTIARQYDSISNAYMMAAAKLGVPTHVLQAATWIQWRIEKGL